MQSALSCLWAAAGVEGCYGRVGGNPSRHVPVPCTVKSLAGHGFLHGVVRVPGVALIVCGAVAVRPDEGEFWAESLAFYLPLGALSEADPRVSGYPAEKDGGAGSFGWRAPIDAWLAEIGRQIFAVVQFQLGVIGWEVSATLDAQELGGNVPDDRGQTGYLMPWAEGLEVHLATS